MNLWLSRMLFGGRSFPPLPAVGGYSIRMFCGGMPMSRPRIVKKGWGCFQAGPVSRKTSALWTSERKGRQRRWWAWCRQRGWGVCIERPSKVKRGRGPKRRGRCSWRRRPVCFTIYRWRPRRLGTISRICWIAIGSYKHYYWSHLLKYWIKYEEHHY